MARPDSVQILTALIESLRDDVPGPLYQARADARTSGENRDPFWAEVVSEDLARKENTPILWVAARVVAVAAEVERCQRRVDELVDRAVRRAGPEVGKEWRS